jgi:hypothetical protein
MAITSRPVNVDGLLWGTVYTFEKAGDVFPVHTHETEAVNHITIVAFGGIKMLGHPRFEGVVAEAKPGGTIINWKAGEPHGFEALVDGTTIVNLLKAR